HATEQGAVRPCSPHVRHSTTGCALRGASPPRRTCKLRGLEQELSRFALGSLQLEALRSFGGQVVEQKRHSGWSDLVEMTQRQALVGRLKEGRAVRDGCVEEPARRQRRARVLKD